MRPTGNCKPARDDRDMTFFSILLDGLDVAFELDAFDTTVGASEFLDFAAFSSAAVTLVSSALFFFGAIVAERVGDERVSG